MEVHCSSSSGYTVFAPAKLNLVFEVLGRRPDGFHEIETLMAPLAFCDELRLRNRADGEITLSCRWAGEVVREHRAFESAALRAPAAADASPDDLPAERQNLVYRALELLRDEAGVQAGADVELIKRIPLAAGLAGGSSDAAAALIAANLAWNLRWPSQRLADVAGRLGSDVPFFLDALAGRRRVAAICRGRGERVEPVGSLPAEWTVVVKPAAGLATADVYRHCRVASEPERSVDRAERLAAALTIGDRRALAAGDPRGCGRLMGNRLEAAAERLSPWPARLRGVFQRSDCVASQMSGSGTSYFGLARHRRHARRTARRLSAQRLGAVFVTQL